MKIITGALVASLACSAAFADPYPVTITDGRDQDVTLTKQPENVAALWVAAADLLVALDRPVLGVTTYEGKMPVYLGDAMADAVDFGDITAPNLELMATSDIDLTIGMTRYNAPYSEEIEAIGSFITFDGFSLEQSLAGIEQLGRALGADQKTAEMNAEFLSLLDDFSARAPQDQKEVLFIWSFQDTLYGYKENPMAATLIKKLGTINPLGREEDPEAADNAFVILEAEDLLALDPDVIFMFISHGGAAKFNAAYERLKAYKANQIYSVGYQYSQPAGPIAREMVLREAAHLIYPDMFEKPDMPDAARAVPVEFAR